MLDQFIYENHLGQRFDGLSNSVYLNTSELRNYTWSYQTINSRISRFYRKTTNRRIPLYVVGQTDAQAIETMNRLFDITEADVAMHVPGKIFVGEYYTTGFVTVSKKTEYLQSKQLCKLEITLTSDDPAWYRDEVHSFYTDATVPKAAKSGDVITVSDVPASPVRGFTLYGKTTQNGTPSPDAPVALQTVGADGNVKVSSCGKNLYNPDMLVFGEPFYNSDGTTQSATNTRVGLIPVEPNTDYTVTAYGSSYIRMAQLDANKVYIRRNILNGNEEGASITITTAANAAYMQVASDRSISKAQIEKGSAATEYEQDAPKTATITTDSGLPGVPVSSGGNYTDANGQQWIADSIEYDAETGVGKQVQRIAPIDFDGSEDYQALNGYFRVLYPRLQAGGSGLCTIGRVYNAFPQNGFYYNATYIYFRFDDAGINSEKMTVAEVKAWVAENPFTLYAILAEPIETDLTTSEFYALRMQSPNTTLYNEDGAYMDVVYSTVANTSGSAVGGFDYPYEYNLEYGVQTGGRNITNGTFTGNAFRILIYGAVINPTITIGGHAYTVNGAVGEGETLTIDSMAKTITLTTANGTKINYFDKRDRQNYIFQPIQPGQNAVTWSGDFGFELTVIEERSEPKWI